MIIFVLNTVRKVLAVADQDGKLDLQECQQNIA